MYYFVIRKALVSKKRQMLHLECKKRNAFLQNELHVFLLKFIKKNNDAAPAKLVLANAFLHRKKRKKKAISYHTSFCVQSGHQKSRVNWGKLSRFAFKSTANKNTFSFLSKKSN